MITEFSREPIRTLVVDDSEDDLLIIQHLLRQYPDAEFEVQAETDVGVALEELETRQFDLLLLDYQMPEMDGVEFLWRAASRTILPPTVMVTGISDYHLVTLALQAGASDCLNKYGMTSRSLGEAIDSVVSEAQRTAQISCREGLLLERLGYAATLLEPTVSASGVMNASLLLGQVLNLSSHEMEILRFGALIHDVGKLGIEAKILGKPASLTDEERVVVRAHPMLGVRLVGALRLSHGLMPMVRSHHERWDGAGYPDGLAGEDIPLLARIVSIGDAFDAMRTDRAYRPALDITEIRAELLAGAGSQWDPQLIELFLQTHPDLQG